MTSRLTLLALLAFFLLTAPGEADEDMTTGNYILDGCVAFAEATSGKKVNDITQAKASECLGAIHAVAFSGSMFHKLCVPADVTYGQMAKVVEKYMDSHLDHLNWDYASLIFNALHTAWPCDLD